ncbi:MAG: helix-turn-helix transcriptional regulator [Hyphomicrobiaceae bacterium]
MSEGSRHAIELAVEAIYDAALDPSQWQLASDLISDATFGGSMLLSYDRHRERAAFAVTSRLNESLLDSYFNHYLKLSPYIAAYADAPLNTPLWADTLVDGQALGKSAYYNEFMVPAGISPTFCGIKLSQQGSVQASIGVNLRRSENASEWQATERRLTYLGRHIVRALEIGQKVDRATAACGTFSGMLEAVAAAVFVIGGRREVLFLNSRAEQLLRRDRLFMTNPSGELHAWRPDDDARLELVLVSGTQDRGLPLKLRSAACDRSYVVWRIPLQGSSRSRSYHWQELAQPEMPGAMTLLMVSPIDCSLFVSSDVIGSVFGLTPAEARLTAAVVRGISVAEYARSMGIQEKTARNQLASVFQKTEVGSQSELAALVIKVVAPVSSCK